MSTALLEEPIVARNGLPSDAALYEVVNGKLLGKAVSAYATWITGRLQNRLGPYAEDHRLGTVVPEMLFLLDAESELKRRPDVAFVSARRWALDREVPMEGDWDVVPNLAIEVVSPNDPYKSVVGKVHEYLEKGVDKVWVIVPEQKCVYVHGPGKAVQLLTESDELDGGTLLPGWRMPLATLFRTAQAVTTTPG